MMKGILKLIHYEMTSACVTCGVVGQCFGFWNSLETNPAAPVLCRGVCRGCLRPLKDQLDALFDLGDLRAKRQQLDQELASMLSAHSQTDSESDTRSAHSHFEIVDNNENPESSDDGLEPLPPDTDWDKVDWSTRPDPIQALIEEDETVEA